MHAVSTRSMHKSIPKSSEILSVHFWASLFLGKFIRDKNTQYFPLVLHWSCGLGTEILKGFFWHDLLANYQLFFIAHGLDH